MEFSIIDHNGVAETTTAPVIDRLDSYTKKYGFVIFLLASLFIYLVSSVFFLDGAIYTTVADDIMISLRFARNLAEGYGLVYNRIGEPVEGYTNFLWVIINSGIFTLIGSENVVPIFTFTLSTFFTVISAIYFKKTLQQLNLKYYNLLTTSYLFLPTVFFFNVGGWETSLILFCSCGVVYSLIREKLWLASAFMTLGVLTRPDFIPFVFVVSLAYPLLYNKGKTIIYPIITLSLWPFLAFIVHTLFRYFYYGDIFPNTYYLKATGIPISTSIFYGFLYSIGVIFSLLIFLIHLRNIHSHHKKLYAFNILVIAFYTIYVIKVGGDAFNHLRLYASVLPIIMLNFSLLINRKTSLFILLFAFLLFPNNGWLSNYISIAKAIVVRTNIYESKSGYPFANGNEERLRLAVEIEKLNLGNKKIALYAAGIVPYYLENSFAIDLLGKCDKHISHLKAHKGKVAHNKWDYDYSLAKYKPDLILSEIRPFDLNNRSFLNREDSPNGFNWHHFLKSKELKEKYSPSKKIEWYPIVFEKKF